MDSDEATIAIRFGSGRSSEEIAVEAVLEQFGVDQSSASYRRITAGITNLNWLVQTGSATLFLKLYGPETAQFITRETSTAASRLAGELGIGPRLLANFSDPGAEIYEYLPGFRTFTGEDLDRPEILERIMTAYRRFHCAALLPENRTGFDQLADRVALAGKLGSRLPADTGFLLEQCARARKVIERAGIDLAPCHNDSYAPNFMINDVDDEIRIIDWEYASNNDPAWDVAMISASTFAPAEKSMLVATAYDPNAGLLADRVFLYAIVVFVSWGIWGLNQAKLSTIDFDFDAYGNLLLEQARLNLNDPWWETALASLATHIGS